MLILQFSTCLMLLLVRLSNISFLFQIVWFGWPALFCTFVWTSLLGSSLLPGFDYSYGALHCPYLYVNLCFVLLFLYGEGIFQKENLFFFHNKNSNLYNVLYHVWLKFYICMNTFAVNETIIRLKVIHYCSNPCCNFFFIF